MATPDAAAAISAQPQTTSTAPHELKLNIKKHLSWLPRDLKIILKLKLQTGGSARGVIVCVRVGGETVLGRVWG